METRRLKDYKGFIIEKSWYTTPNGKIGICYTSYTLDSTALYDAAPTLPELKKKIDRYVNCK